MPKQELLSLFEALDYKEFLNAYIDTLPKNGRGVRRQLADALRCQVPFISHVLAGNYHFSAEQAEGLTRFFSWTREEAEFFILLVQENRAGTRELKDFLQKNLSELREKNNLLKNRLKIKESLSAGDQARYYSQWFISAIHMLTTIPDFQNPKAISERLSLPQSLVNETLIFLQRAGLVKSVHKNFEATNKALHLEKSSPFLTQHHTQWRLRAVDAVKRESREELHYSAVFSVAKKDLPKLRETLSRALEGMTQTIRQSKDEDIAALNLDLFWV